MSHVKTDNFCPLYYISQGSTFSIIPLVISRVSLYTHSQRYLKRNMRRAVREYLLYTVGSLHGDGALFHDNLWLLGNLGDLSRGRLHEFKIRRTSLSDAKGLGRRVDRDEDEVGLDYCSLRVGREEEVFPADFFDDFLKAGFVNGEIVGVPGIDARLAQVHYCHL